MLSTWFSRINKCVAPVVAVAAALAMAGLAGCGAGGYPGGGITSLSASAVTIDAGQSFSTTAKLTGNLTVVWTLTGANCSGASCGTLSTTTGTTVTYTAPSGITSQMLVTATASVINTKNSSSVAITVNPDPTITGTPPSGTVGVAYTTTLVAAGGTAPLTMSLQSGSLPPGLTFDAATGVISGTPTTAGVYNFTVQLVDSSSIPYTVTAAETIVVFTNPSTPPLSLTASTLPNGTVGVPYSATIGVTGGTSPYTCTVTAGTLPAGLAMGAGCLVSGTPTKAGTFTVTVKVTDSSYPQETTTGPETIIISPVPLKLTTSTLPNGTVGVPYSATIGVTGGTAPYTCTVTGGTLPAGLAMGAGCLVSGTPTKAGTVTVTVTVTDSSNPVLTTTGPETIVIAPAPLSLTTSTLPNGTVGVAYSATIGVTGGTAPYNCLIASGSLPAGLILGSGCLVSGTPTTAGTTTFNVTATDSSNPMLTTTGPETIVIAPAPLKLTLSTLPNGTVNVPYTATIGVSGGTAPYNCTITAGTLPAGLTISGCTVSGTPTTAETSTVTVMVTDASNPQETTTGPETITIDAASAVLTVSTLPNGTVGVPYSSTITTSGGTSPYTCVITGLPAGLTASNCTVSGTPTTPGTSTVTVKVTDSSNPSLSTTATDTVVIAGVGTLSLTGTLPNGTVGTPYSQSLTATGGTTPYTYSITAGGLPAGLTLSQSGNAAVISGTPTTPGASSFTLTVKDSSTTQQTASLPLVLLVVYATGVNDGELNGPYAYLFQGYDDVAAGVLAYQTATVGSFTANGAGVLSAGEFDANHQSSTPSGTTVATQNFIGTYEIGSDNRGLITITVINSDGTTGASTTYAISVNAPVSPSTISTQGDLIEFDGNQLVGTRGSGTLLAQTASAITAGLKGSYAFGFYGDTPCLVSCALNLNLFGPAATVGQFTTDSANSTITGLADANVASVNFASTQLSGSYGAADQNGRVQLVLANATDPGGVYPSNYAAYIVNANELLIMSTDEHSAYILQAGTAQLQSTPGGFTSASLNGPLVGYENTLPNPGLVDGTLESVLNLSSAEIFRANCDGTKTCDTTDVDNAGLTSLVNGLSATVLNTLGLSKTQLLQGLLGAYASTGNSTYTSISGNGRGELSYPPPQNGLLGGILSGLLGSLLPNGTPPPRVFYLVGPNQGYFLESGYAGIGQFEPQTGSPFTLATLSGTYVEGTIPAASLANINTSGFFTADGKGNVPNFTLDENIGVGTINVLQLGVTGSTTYNLSDTSPNNPATTGRYLLGDGTTVIYAISPNRFVLVNTNVLATAPGVSLLYK